MLKIWQLRWYCKCNLSRSCRSSLSWLLYIWVSICFIINYKLIIIIIIWDKFVLYELTKLAVWLHGALCAICNNMGNSDSLLKWFCNSCLYVQNIGNLLQLRWYSTPIATKFRYCDSWVKHKTNAWFYPSIDINWTWLMGQPMYPEHLWKHGLHLTHALYSSRRSSIVLGFSSSIGICLSWKSVSLLLSLVIIDKVSNFVRWVMSTTESKLAERDKNS